MSLEEMRLEAMRVGMEHAPDAVPMESVIESALMVLAFLQGEPAGLSRSEGILRIAPESPHVSYPDWDAPRNK